MGYLATRYWNTSLPYQLLTSAYFMKTILIKMIINESLLYCGFNRPIARTVADAVHVLDVIVGRDDNDQGTIQASAHIPTCGYAQYLKSNGLNGKRLGILRSPNAFNFAEGSVENTTYQQLFQIMR